MEDLLTTEEHLSTFRRTSVRNEEVMKSYIKEGAAQIDYFKKQARRHKETAERYKKKLFEAETRIEEQKKMISTFESIQASLDAQRRKGEEREKALRRSQSNEAFLKRMLENSVRSPTSDQLNDQLENGLSVSQSMYEEPASVLEQ